MDVSVKHSELSDILIKENKDSMIEFIKIKFNLSDDQVVAYKRQIDQFVINHDFRWKKKSKFRKDHFQKQYRQWLEENFSLKPPSAKRVLKPFDQCSDRTKKRRLAAGIETEQNPTSNPTSDGDDDDSSE